MYADYKYRHLKIDFDIEDLSYKYDSSRVKLLKDLVQPHRQNLHKYINLIIYQYCLSLLSLKINVFFHAWRN